MAKSNFIDFKPSNNPNYKYSYIDEIPGKVGLRIDIGNGNLVYWDWEIELRECECGNDFEQLSDEYCEECCTEGESGLIGFVEHYPRFLSEYENRFKTEGRYERMYPHSARMIKALKGIWRLPKGIDPSIPF